MDAKEEIRLRLNAITYIFNKQKLMEVSGFFRAALSGDYKEETRFSIPDYMGCMSSTEVCKTFQGLSSYTINGYQDSLTGFDSDYEFS